jgi:hypothetical protein
MAPPSARSPAGPSALLAVLRALGITDLDPQPAPQQGETVM